MENWTEQIVSIRSSKNNPHGFTETSTFEVVKDYGDTIFLKGWRRPFRKNEFKIRHSNKQSIDSRILMPSGETINLK